jgi:uncharacterized protein DUF6941
MQLIAAMIADAAVVEKGKLYIHGGGWDTIWAGQVPATHASLTLALLFRIEYSEALTDIPISIELVDEDGNGIGVPTVAGKVNVGHAPGTKPGWPVFLPQALTFPMLRLPKIGGYSFRITSGSRELGSAVFRVAPLSEIPPGLAPTILPGQV